MNPDTLRFPAEWEKQTAVLIAWPDKSGDFSANIEQVENAYCFIAKTIVRFQHLIIICKSVQHQEHIQGILKHTDRIHYIHSEFNDIWLRDTTFITVESPQQAQLLNFQFNGWGEKYPYQADNKINHQLAEHSIFNRAQYKDIDLVLEGGSIESDGQGSILTTKQCLLNPNRNPQLTQTEIENQLKSHLGAQRILWIDQENLSGDDTDAHIDTLARFCNPHTIAYTACTDPQDPHYAGLLNMQTQLQALRTVTGEAYQLISLPMPKAIYSSSGEQLPANYANFLIINQAVMVPVYNDPKDEIALTRLTKCFPEHEIIATPCKAIVEQYGSLHCMTMQIPNTVELNYE